MVIVHLDLNVIILSTVEVAICSAQAIRATHQVPSLSFGHLAIFPSFPDLMLAAVSH